MNRNSLSAWQISLCVRDKKWPNCCIYQYCAWKTTTHGEMSANICAYDLCPFDIARDLGSLCSREELGCGGEEKKSSAGLRSAGKSKASFPRQAIRVMDGYRGRLSLSERLRLETKTHEKKPKRSKKRKFRQGSTNCFLLQTVRLYEILSCPKIRSRWWRKWCLHAAKHHIKLRRSA